MDEISRCIESNILVTGCTAPGSAPIVAPRGFPLSNGSIQSAPSSLLRLSKDINWSKLLTGRGALGPGQEPPTLSLAKTERDSTARSRLDSGEASLGVSFDIDSVTFEATSLAVHRGSFKLFLAPNFLQSIRQDQKINVQGLTTPLHQTKHIALGSGHYSSGINFTTYMVFPHYPAIRARGEKKVVGHLDHKSLEVLYNAAIFPAIKHKCVTHITQHIPVSFQDAYAKAHANSEIGRGGGNSTGIGLTAQIPHDDLKDIWTDIIARCATLQGPYTSQGCVFRDPILIVQAHDTKLSLARSPTQQETYEKFCTNMNRMFHMAPERYVNRKNYWVDFARETISKEEGCTALGKRECLEHRVRKALQQPKQKANSVTRYPMAGLWDVGALTVKMHQKSALFAGGLVDVKAYNVNKEQLAVPVKNHSPFDNYSMEGLGYTEDRLGDWYEAGTGRKIAPEERATLKRLIRILEATKKRLWAAFTDSSSSSYGVREEYRITFTLFEAYIGQLSRPVELAREGSVLVPELPPRLPFWIVDTASLNRFRIADANRWLSCLESIIETTTNFRAGKKECDSLTRDPDQHSPLASAMCRLLNSSLGCHASDRSIWQGQSQRRRRKGPNAEQRLPLKEGLNMKAISKACGMMWFPPANIAGQRLLEDQISPPRIRQSLRATLAIGETGLHRLFKKKDITLDSATRLNGQLATLGSLLETAAQEVGGLSTWEARVPIYCAAAQVCIQAYQQWMWGILQQRFVQHVKAKATRSNVEITPSYFQAFVVEHGGTKDLLDGLVSVGYGQIQGVFSTVADIPLVSIQPSARTSRFKTHESGTWSERIRTLFFPEDGQFAKATLPFVTLAQKFSTIIARALREHQVTDNTAAIIGEEEWRHFLCKTAAGRMFAMLQYDFSSPAVLRRPLKNQARQTELERTGLYAAAADPDVYDAAEHNALLRAWADKHQLYKACSKAAHSEFLKQIYRYEGGLPVYHKAAAPKGRKGKNSAPPPSQVEALFAHGHILKQAVQFEQHALLVHGNAAAETDDSAEEDDATDSEDEDELL